MNFRRLSDNELADFAANVLTLFWANVCAKATDTAVRTKLVAA